MAEPVPAGSDLSAGTYKCTSCGTTIDVILVSAAVINGGDSHGTDEFVARQAWLYVAIVAGAYFIGRGLAKSGARDPYTEDRDDGDRNGR